MEGNWQEIEYYMEKGIERKIDLSIVIVTYNSFETIKQCVDSVEKTIKKNSFEIVVIDNDSKDDTSELARNLEKQYKNLLFIKNKENCGFSKANNIGIKHTSGRFLLFLNPDTLVYKNTIDGMIDFMDKTTNAGAATCFVELKNGKLDDSCHRGFPTPWRSSCYFMGLSRLFPKSKLFAGYNMTYLDLEKTHEIDSLAGSFMITRREVGEKLGWWDEDFFFYGEDLDFCFRIKQLGYKVYFVPSYRALHYKGVSSGIKKVSKEISKATRETRLFATRHRFNAMRIFYNKHYEERYPKVVTWLVYKAIDLKKWFGSSYLKEKTSHYNKDEAQYD